MIYGGPSTRLSTRQRKQERREVFSVQLATPLFLDWSEVAITFDRDDHPDYVPNRGVYPLVVDPIIANTRLTKVLMDGGSVLTLSMPRPSTFWESRGRTSDLASGASMESCQGSEQSLSSGSTYLSVCFGTPANFRKETLTFEVVGFHGTYHAILRRPCYAQFMAVPNYTYLKLKISGPNGVITVGPSYEHAYECDVEYVEHGEAILESATLAANLDGLANEVPDPKHHAGNFGPAKTSSSYLSTPPIQKERR
jgi:hypothetical protein